ncbi:MAG: ATP-binding cassette domain-containing protein [Thermoleophilia bacterium]|nr:ATP-binding cassette domain-containing protein [Thermoleophilia bacterium]
MIRIEGFRVRAGDFSLAIDDLYVARGEYLMVLGPTASGKTVLLETLAGLRRPQEGHVRLGERDVTAEAPEKRGVGLVYQDYALFPHLTVARNIGFGLRTHGGAGDHTEHVRQLAALLHIDGLLDRYPEGLSGGEQQRVALARALATRPEVLLLDEPLSALDGPTRSELQGELKRLHEELGTTVVHVTHDLDEALALGDRMAVLMGGRVRQIGTPLEVTRHPVDTEVARLVGMANVFRVATVECDAQPIAKEAPVRVFLENGQEVFARMGPAVGPLERLSAVIPADEIELWPPPGGSGRVLANQDEDDATSRATILDGTLGAVQIQSTYAAVGIEVPPERTGVASLRITVHVPRPQVERLGLVAGLHVLLRIPWTAVHLCSDADRTATGA